MGSGSLKSALPSTATWSGGDGCSPLSHETLGTSETGLLRISVGARQPEQEFAIENERLKAFTYSANSQLFRIS